MLLGSRSGRASSSSSSGRFTLRAVYRVSIAGCLLLTLSILTLPPWSSRVDEVLSRTTRFLGRPTSGAGITPPIAPPPLVPQPPSPISDLLVSAPLEALPQTPPDPLQLPGRREGAKWVTNDPNVQLHHWLQYIIDGHGDRTEFNWARNKTVLLLGDSVLRGWVYHLCDDFVEGRKNRVTFSDDADVDEKNEGWECIIPSTGTRFINGFVYGMTNYSKYPLDSPLISKDWPVGPWGTEDRIPQIVDQYAQYDVDMVVLNSGAWDMKFMYRRDVFEGKRHNDIEETELLELSERLRECMHMVKTAWPASKLAFLQVQPFDPQDTLNRWIWAQNLTEYGGHDWKVDFSVFISPSQSLGYVSETLPPMFTRRRVSQLATTYRRVAAEEEWDSLDLWKIAEASAPDEFYPKADPVHPAVPSIQIILDFVLEMLWRWEIYKA